MSTKIINFHPNLTKSCKFQSKFDQFSTKNGQFQPKCVNFIPHLTKSCKLQSKFDQFSRLTTRIDNSCYARLMESIGWVSFTCEKCWGGKESAIRGRARRLATRTTSSLQQLLTGGCCSVLDLYFYVLVRDADGRVYFWVAETCLVVSVLVSVVC